MINLKIVTSNSLLQNDVKELKIDGGRANNIIGRMGIKTIDELFARLNEVEKFPGAGKTTVNIFKTAIINYVIENSTYEQLRQMKLSITTKTGKGENVEIVRE